MAKAFSFRSVSIDNGLYWRAQRWARFLAWLGEGKLAAATQARVGAATNAPRSLLVVVILVVVIFIVVVGLTGRIVRRVALVVPELAVGAVGREQFAHASRARSPCRLKSR